MKLINKIVLEQDQIIEICVKYIIEKYNKNIEITKVDINKKSNTDKYQFEFTVHEKEIDNWTLRLLLTASNALTS
jgi:hypothetical protein